MSKYCQNFFFYLFKLTTAVTARLVPGIPVGLICRHSSCIEIIPGIIINTWNHNNSWNYDVVTIIPVTVNICNYNTWRHDCTDNSFHLFSRMFATLICSLFLLMSTQGIVWNQIYILINDLFISTKFILK